MFAIAWRTEKEAVAGPQRTVATAAASDKPLPAAPPSAAAAAASNSSSAAAAAVPSRSPTATLVSPSVVLVSATSTSTAAGGAAADGAAAAANAHDWHVLCMNVFCYLWIPAMFSHAAFFQRVSSSSFAALLICYPIFVTAGGENGGLFGGYLLGRSYPLRAISPKKTREGFIAQVRTVRPSGSQSVRQSGSQWVSGCVGQHSRSLRGAFLFLACLFVFRFVCLFFFAFLLAPTSVDAFCFSKKS